MGSCMRFIVIINILCHLAAEFFMRSFAYSLEHAFRIRKLNNRYEFITNLTQAPRREIFLYS